jgi:nucleotide-binding universal stress UspA family protein
MRGIVVGVSDSATGAAALDWALEQAVLRRVPLTAVRAWDIPSYGPYYSVGAALRSTAPEFELTEQKIAQDALNAAIARVPGSHDVDANAVASRGRPAQVLVDDASDAELLVVGTRGVGALSRLVHLGSVTSAVLHHASGPVAVVPEGAARSRSTARVVVGLDDSPRSQPALAWAVAEAALAGAVLVPVKVMSGDAGRATAHDDVRRELAAAAAAAGADRAGLQVLPELREGHAADELIAAAGDDLLVMGTRGRGGFAALVLGSTTHQVAGHARGPVVVVRSQ